LPVINREITPMFRRWLAASICLLVVVSASMSLGCARFYSRERMARRQYIYDRETDLMVDDIEWALGVDDPSMLYEDSFPPHP
jgi:hypothetical protein